MGSLDVQVAQQAAELLALVTEGRATTKPEIGTATGWGRTQVNQRLSLLLDAGLVTDDGLAPAGRGRAPRALRLVATRGQVISVCFGNNRTQVGAHDLTGRLVSSTEVPGGSLAGPHEVLPRVRDAVDRLLEENPEMPLWGIGVGVPAPVEFREGRLASSPLSMPGWQTQDFSDAVHNYQAPAWLDNDVNIMALGEARHGDHTEGTTEIVYLKVGTWMGAGLIGSGNLYRGWLGCAGEVPT